MDLEMEPPHVKLCRIPLLPTPLLSNKDVQVMVLWKDIIKKQKCHGLSKCQFNFPCVFSIKMGVTVSSKIYLRTTHVLCSFIERPKLIMKTYN